MSVKLFNYGRPIFNMGEELVGSVQTSSRKMLRMGRVIGVFSRVVEVPALYGENG